MTATAPAPASASTIAPTLKDVKAVVRELTAGERGELLEYVWHLHRLEDPEYQAKINAAAERLAAGKRVSMEEFIRENAGPEPTA